MKTRIFGILLYQLIIITVTTSIRTLCYNNNYCKCWEESDYHYFYYCGETHTSHFLILDIIRYDHIKYIKMYCVQPYDERNYIRWLQDIYELPTKQIKITLQQCPLPDEPFVNIFDVFGAENVTDFIFMMVTPAAGLKTTTFEPYHFANLSSLKRLHLSFDGIEQLSDDLFTDMVNLKGLHLHENRIKSLPVKIFDPLKRLRELSLYLNELTSIDGRMFQNLSKLRKLNLRKNKLDNITASTFNSLIGLKKLELSDNNMTILNDGLFDNMKNLTVLDLSGNKLIRVPEQLFPNGSNLEELLLRDAFDMDKNFTIPPRFFYDLFSLKVLNLEDNNLSFLRGSYIHRNNRTLISV